ncbi:MAG: alginate biosynthesis protein Alg44 [Alphaproteobacteria bacterium]|nr:alginate biosynthesis protein Alg44 [Alphaproteobacteria bacterium]
MGSSTVNIVHESEAQRQFVRLPVPAEATFDGQTYIVKDLTAGGLSIVDVGRALNDGQAVKVSLFLPFSSFGLTMELDAIVKYYLPSEKVAGMQFTGLTPDQVSLLNHVVKSFMAGEVVRSGDLMNVAARDNFTKARPKKMVDGKPVVELKRQIPGLLLVTILGIVALGFILNNIYENVFIFKTNNASVQASTIQVRSVERGLLTSKIKPGQTTIQNRGEIGTVNGNDVKSPCDCLITKVHRHTGEFVVEGEPLVSLVQANAVPWVQVTVKPEDARKLNIGTKATIAIAGSKAELTGTVDSIKTETNEWGDAPVFPSVSNQVYVIVKPDGKIPSELINRPAHVVFQLR